jgi:hypothetical protein
MVVRFVAMVGARNSTPSSCDLSTSQGTRRPHRQAKPIPLSHPSRSFAPLRRRVDEHVVASLGRRRGGVPQPPPRPSQGLRGAERGATRPRTYTVKLGRHLWTRGKAVRGAESEANEKQAPRIRLCSEFLTFCIPL